MMRTMRTDSDHPARWISIRGIEGAVAMWATRQSPYVCPEDLVLVLQKLDEELRSGKNLPGWLWVSPFDKHGFAELTPRQVEQLLEQSLKAIPEFWGWNETRNAKLGLKPNPEFVFVSRYGGPPADDDFIDLDALIRNVVHTVFLEADKDAAFDAGFERDWNSWPARLSRWWHQHFPTAVEEPS